MIYRYMDFTGEGERLSLMQSGISEVRRTSERKENVVIETDNETWSEWNEVEIGERCKREIVTRWTCM